MWCGVVVWCGVVGCGVVGWGGRCMLVGVYVPLFAVESFLECIVSVTV